MELLDGPLEDSSELASNLRDLELINRYFFGAEPIARAILAGPARSVVDVGCGGADIPRAVVHAARTRRRTIEVTCVDQSEHMLEQARSRSAGFGELSFLHAEGTSLPFADGAFDVAMSSLTLHHCEPPAAVAFLRELRRVSRLRPVVGDLRRTPLGYLGAHLVGLISGNRLTRHDAPLSVRRAYTVPEARELAHAAGWRHVQARTTPFFRLLLTDGE